MLIQIKKHSDKINLDGVAFQYFIDEFSKQNENEFKIIVLDNAAFHKVKSLQLLDNIELMFLPPYSSELNLAEKIWWKFKREFSNKLFKNLEKLSDFLSDLANSLTKEDVASISSYNYATNLY